MFGHFPVQFWIYERKILFPVCKTSGQYYVKAGNIAVLFARRRKNKDRLVSSHTESKAKKTHSDISNIRCIAQKEYRKDDQEL